MFEGGSSKDLSLSEDSYRSGGEAVVYTLFKRLYYMCCD